MTRTLTVRNRKHPHNIMHEVGQAAKVKVRQLSNDQLDKFLTDNIDNKEALSFALGLNRSKKIKFVKDTSMAVFSKRYKAAQEGKKNATR